MRCVIPHGLQECVAALLVGPGKLACTFGREAEVEFGRGKGREIIGATGKIDIARIAAKRRRQVFRAVMIDRIVPVEKRFELLDRR